LESTFVNGSRLDALDAISILQRTILHNALLLLLLLLLRLLLRLLLLMMMKRRIWSTSTSADVAESRADLSWTR
jgi:hypothetical protein